MASRFKAGARLQFTQQVNGKTVTRTGEVWSDGPVVSSLWVLPDGDRRNPVPVKLPTARQEDAGQLPEAFVHNSPAQQELLAARCSNVSRRGQVYAVLDADLLGNTLSYHADPGCPLAAGKEPARQHGRPLTVSAHRVIDLLSGKGGVGLNLCRRCVWLDMEVTR